MVTTYEAGVKSDGLDGGPIQVREGRAATAHRSTASVAGHPLHPMMVPIPIGLLSAAAVSDLVFTLTRDAFWARASRWLLRGGLLGGLLAAPLGAIDFRSIPAARSATGVGHAVGNTVILALTAASLAVRRGEPRAVPPAAMLLSALAAALLAVTGWLGGELSYREGVGVIPDEDR